MNGPRDQFSDRARRGRRYFIGEWFEAAAVAFLFALWLTLERRMRAAHRFHASRPCAAVWGGRGRFALRGRVRERIPVDGRIVAGESSADQAPITGEAIPVAKEADSQVFAGTINGVLEIENSKAAEDTILARIIRLAPAAVDGTIEDV